MWEDKLLFLLLLVLASVALAPGLATTKPQLFAHPTYACALRSTGHVDCWGHGPSGASVAAPTNQQFWAISSGVSFTCALAYDGYVQCWGEEAMSYSSTAQSIMVRDQSMCVRTDDLHFDCRGAEIEMNGNHSFSQVAFTQNRACGILADTGSPICWSQKAFGQVHESMVLAQIVMGDSWACGVEQGTGALRCLAPVAPPPVGSPPPQPPPGAFLPGTLVSNRDDFCALSANHFAACWGNSSPAKPAGSIGATAFVQLTLGEGFVCGLQADGSPLCWGNNAHGVLNPPAGVRFVLLAASRGYACGMRDDEVTVCWGDAAPTNRPCPTACFGNGTLDGAECRCQCPSVERDCTCPVDTCNNGGRVLNDGSCSCECHNACAGAGCVRTADCSCRCAATQPHPNLGAVPDSAPASALSYRIAGAESTFPVERLTGQTIAGATECSQALLYLRLLDTGAWSGASCADSGSLFMGANMANLDINQHPLASVRLSGDQDGGWLYRIVKCVPTTNTLLLCPRNWLMDSVHCPGPDRDCSQCLPLGRGLTDTADYETTCTEGPAPAQAAQLRSVVLAGGYAGYHAEPNGTLWRVALPPGVTCATRFLMFRAQEWRVDLGALIVKLHADGNGDYQYVYRGCSGTATVPSSLLLKPFQWTVSPAHCPHLDCSLCLAASQGYCLTSHMAPYGLEAVFNSLNTSVSLSWGDSGAPPGTNYAVYLRYITTARQLEISLEGTGLGPRLQAKVVRVYCPTTCAAGGCSSNSLAGVQLARSVAERDECVDGLVDCMGVCNGTALRNPCGVCALPENYHRGDGYWVDCANTCGGSAYVGECGVCVDGRSGLPPNAHKDCQGTCFGKATRDECGVCHAEGDDSSSRDCTGVCGGKAVVDECGECVLGTTGREFNAAKDCAGQCFGGRLPTDPACQCEGERLDKCFVCGGDNSTCAGCDGVPNSGLVRDLCGVCGGDNTTCCFLPFAQATVVIRDLQAIAVRSTLDAGETLLVQNLHAGRDYTVTLERLGDDDDDDGGAKRQLSFFSPTLRPGNSLHIEISQPGQYRLTTVESSTVSTHLTVRYNAKTTDACGRCIDRSDLLKDASPLAHVAAYEHCCAVMESNNVHAWFASTHHRRDADLALHATTRVAQRTENYRSAPTRHLLRLVKPQMVDTSVWSAVDQRLAVGDVVVLENRDLLDHVVSIIGPQPMPDVVLDRGTVAVAGPVLTPGTYRVVSRSHLINTTFTVEFAFACTVHAHDDGDEQPQPATTAAGRYHAAVIGLTLVGSFTLAALLVAAIVVAAIHLRPRREQ